MISSDIESSLGNPATPATTYAVIVTESQTVRKGLKG